MKNRVLSLTILFLSTVTLSANPFSYDCDRAFLGINSETVSYEKAERLGFQNPHGVYVTTVLRNTAAEEAGLQPFDYIYAIDEFEMTDNQGLTDVLNKFEPGDKATIHFIRKGKSKSSKVRLGEYKSFCGTNGLVKKSFLGVQKEDITDDGIEVAVIRGTSAERMGLQDGDVITEIDGIKMVDWKDLTVMMKTKSSDEDIQIKYLRNGQSNTANGELKSYADGQAERFRLNEEEMEERFERFEDKMEIWSERIEEEADKLSEEIEDNVEKYLERRRNRNTEDDIRIDEKDLEDGDSGYNEDLRLNQSPNQNSQLNINELDAVITEVSPEEYASMEGIIQYENTSNLTIENINLSPNVQSGQFQLTFDLPQNGNTVVQLFNGTGRMVYEYEMGQFSGQFEDEVDVSQNAPGEYFLIVKQGENTAVRKVEFELQ